MKIVVALDSFKGSLSAAEAVSTVAEVLQRESPSSCVVQKPMADGGEGTAAALLASSTSGAWVPVEVMGPLPAMKVHGGFGWFSDTKEAVVEMASASGLILLETKELNPMLTTTYGTGQLLLAAAERGATRIRLAVGGSATVDGGVGAAMAMGWGFLDRDGEAIPLGGAGLERLESIKPPTQPWGIPIEVLCDVDSSLCGPAGAAAVYGPQKGATPEMVERLDRALARMARLAEEVTGEGILSLAGGGAAGGLAAGTVLFMGAKLVSGVRCVMEASGLTDALAGADWVVTGEGRFDEQSLHGKVVSGVLSEAKARGVKVAVLAGSVALASADYHAQGVEVAYATKPEAMPLNEALKQARDLLALTARRFVEEHLR